MNYKIRVIFSDNNEVLANVEADTRAEVWKRLQDNEEFRAFQGDRVITSHVICLSDQPEEKEDPYDIYTENGRVMIRRTTPPRFVGVVTMDINSDIDIIEWKDECSIAQATAALRKAGEFLRKNSRKNKQSN